MKSAILACALLLLSCAPDRQRLSDIADLKQAFNNARNQTRVVALLSPT